MSAEIDRRWYIGKKFQPVRPFPVRRAEESCTTSFGEEFFGTWNAFSNFWSRSINLILPVSAFRWHCKVRSNHLVKRRPADMHLRLNPTIRANYKAASVHTIYDLTTKKKRIGLFCLMLGLGVCLIESICMPRNTQRLDAGFLVLWRQGELLTRGKSFALLSWLSDSG